MGRALTVLTDQPEEEHSVALTTMIRVLSVVDWSEFPEDSYAMLYENFLAAYDPALRRKSGVYYTPAALVSFVTRFVDDVLRLRLGRDLGFAESDVIVVDPAMGTGSFLAEVVNTVARTVEAEEGYGAVAPRLRELSNRLIGFENQAAPYAVAELRIHSLLKKRHRAEVPAKERRFLADTLDDPDVQLLPMGRMYEAFERSRRGANVVKQEEPVMVVLGNPPYVDKVKGTAPWIETANPTPSSPSLTAFRKHGNGRLEYVLSNKYVHFWRWATWKAFDAHVEHPEGVIAFVCSAGFTTGPGFAGMREYLRRTTDEGWIIDLTPEGHQPPMETRFFRSNQQPICVAVFIRIGVPNSDTPAQVHRTPAAGSVTEKAQMLRALNLDGPEWSDCGSGWNDPFRPVEEDDRWRSMPATVDLIPWATPGVKPNRTWVYAPEESTLRQRWSYLIRASAGEKQILLKDTRSTKVNSIISPVPGMFAHNPDETIATETNPCPQPRRIAYRSFDRKWVIPDARLHDTPRPSLWLTSSDKQIYVVEQHAHPISGGPALVFTSLIPDMDHFMGHHGGRTLPLYLNGEASVANITPGLLNFFEGRFNQKVDPQDVIAYTAAVTAHPGFTRRFKNELKTPGIRVPLTDDPDLWANAIDIGQEVLWLHTYGERCIDSSSGRHSGPPRMRSGRPKVQVRIPDSEDGMPERICYDEDTQTLRVGSGEIAPVSTQVWTYAVSGMPVVKHWFGYRKKVPTGKRTSPLDDIVANTWTSEMTTELLDLLNVLTLCVALEPRQEDLLDRILDGPLITVDDLTAAAILPVPPAARKIPKPHQENDLFSTE
ncbi:hypothetical protein GCM10029964_051290 [Kibdelosporangium lantanae]